MKKFSSKIKKTYKNFINGKSGFSLVELIVVIAIMAVMAAVLAPALLGYTEKSRAQKDDSALNEVTNSMQLALADADIYDELVNFAVEDNYSCYCDGDSTTNTNANRTITKSPNLWLFNDNARLLDETVYKPAGKMRGVTVTFKPNGKSEYILKDGIVNQIGNDSTKKGSDAGKTLSDTSFEGLYNRVRSTIGDTLKVSSQTYRNSDYTIFISMGTTGGNQADKQDAIKVYGQYNGTNLPEVAAPVAGAGQGAPAGGSGGSEQPGGGAQNLNRNGIIPTGATYTPNGGAVLVGDGTNTFPDAPQTGNTYEEGDYTYKYNYWYNYAGNAWVSATSQNGWGVRVKDISKTSYGEIVSEIVGKPITNIRFTFYDCKSLTTAPVIPNSVTNMYGTFRGCTQLTTAPAIPNSVTNMQDTFADCTSLATPPDMSDATRVTNMRYTFGDCYALTTAPAIPSSVTNMDSTFYKCYSLTTAPTIPNSVTNMGGTFANCTSLTTAPVIPNGVTNMQKTFYNCPSLTGTIEVNANPTSYNSCFKGTVKPITLTGSSTKKSQLASTANKNNITVQ